MDTFPSIDAIVRVLDKLELRMLHRFYSGNTRTMKHDLYPQHEDVAVSGFYFGMHFGMMVVLFVWVIWDSVIDDSKHHNLWESSVMAVYRAIGTNPCYGAGCTSLYMYKHVGVLVLLLWCWCVQVYVFTRFGIPFVAIFDWKPTKSVQFVSLVRHAVSVTIAYLLYYKALRGDLPPLVPPCVFPLLLYLFLLIKLVYPFKQRRSLLTTMWRVVASPWSIVRFREAYVGDIFTSLVRVFVMPSIKYILYDKAWARLALVHLENTSSGTSSRSNRMLGSETNRTRAAAAAITSVSQLARYITTVGVPAKRLSITTVPDTATATSLA
ncbi:hypothetical protein DYB30_000815 [Aphanomyces astaci]|uniref:EXS domain-containing protein n=1 Tax=Aphanomyces astaci TaxID=112090 RepID=A0A397D663_APHAT|nr:hypothetical protein DYB30_000815 [Aphanomyces astaci]RHZ16185.1 hypothetical protein DYB31_001739 [Aphanomyces astaci]